MIRSLLAALAGILFSLMACTSYVAEPGDLVIIASWAMLDDAEAREHRPTVVLVDDKNRIKEARNHEHLGPDLGVIAV